MNTALLPLLLAASTAIAVSAAPPAAAPVYWRLGVIDVSASMDGEPLAEVRRELTTQLKQTPVSIASPMTFVKFSSAAHPPQSFVDQDAALKFVAALASDSGGTSIGAALQAALKELKSRPDLAGVALLLYTDDQDSDRAAIKTAETELDKLFHERSERGLSQAVYLRSWSSGGGMSDLLAVLGKRPYIATAESATEGQIVPVRITPKVKIDESLPVGANSARVKFRMYLDAQVPSGYAAPVVKFELRDAKSPNSWVVTALEHPIAGEAELIYNEPATAFSRAVLRLAVVPQPPAPGKGQGRALPLLSTSLLEIPILFKFIREFEMTGKLVPTGKVRWDMRDANRIIYELKCDVGVRKRGNYEEGETFRIKLRDAGKWRLESGPHVASVTTKSVESFIVEASTVWSDADMSQGLPPQDATLELAAAALPAGVKLIKDVVRVAAGPLPPPLKTKTRVEVVVDSVSPALWYEFPDIAVFRVALRVSTTGSLPANSQFLVVSPGEVQQLRLNPSTIASGRQTIFMDVAARVKAGPATTTLQFVVTPPTVTTGRIACTERVQVDVVGPLPTQLRPVAARDGLNSVSLTAPIDATVAEGNFAAALSGPVTARFAKGLRWRLHAVSPAVSAGPAVGLPETAHCRLSLAPHETASYFRDQVDGFSLKVVPAAPAAAVRGGSFQCEVVRQAPFKRHLLIAAAALAVVLAPWMIYQLLGSLRLGRDDEATTFDLDPFEANDARSAGA